MRSDLQLPYSAVEELIEAFDISFDAFDPAMLSSPTAARHLQKVNRWRASIAPLLDTRPSAETSGETPMRLPSFPITGAELRALQLAVERTQARHADVPVLEEDAERAHQAEIHAIPSSVSRRVRESFGAAHQSSFFLMGMLVILLALNVVNAFFVHSEKTKLVMVASLGLICLTLLVSVWHHFALTRHGHVIHQHLLHRHGGRPVL